MEQKVKIDLSSPPPLPTEAMPKKAPPPVPVPEPPAPKPPSQKPQPSAPEQLPKERPRKEPQRSEPKKRSPLIPALLVAAAAALLFFGYRSIHFWSDPTCTQRARCSLCGLEQGEFAAHTWDYSDGCDVPASCSVCGVSAQSAPGHRYSDGVCTVCGAEQNSALLWWAPTSGHDAVLTYHSQDHALEVSDSTLHNFSQMSIELLDWQDRAVSTDRYTVERSEQTVRLNLPRDLAPGRYVLCAGVQGTQVLQFRFGSADSWLPDDADAWASDFLLRSHAHGLYLASTAQEPPLQGVASEADATRFETIWQICQAGYTTDGTAVLRQEGIAQKFEADRYLRFPSGSSDPAAAETAWVLHYQGWYLTMNSAGEVSLTDTPDGDCFWIISGRVE